MFAPRALCFTLMGSTIKKALAVGGFSFLSAVFLIQTNLFQSTAFAWDEPTETLSLIDGPEDPDAVAYVESLFDARDQMVDYAVEYLERHGQDKFDTAVDRDEIRLGTVNDPLKMDVSYVDDVPVVRVFDNQAQHAYLFLEPERIDPHSVHLRRYRRQMGYYRVRADVKGATGVDTTYVWAKEKQRPGQGAQGTPIQMTHYPRIKKASVDGVVGWFQSHWRPVEKRHLVFGIVSGVVNTVLTSVVVTEAFHHLYGTPDTWDSFFVYGISGTAYSIFSPTIRSMVNAGDNEGHKALKGSIWGLVVNATMIGVAQGAHAVFAFWDPQVLKNWAFIFLNKSISSPVKRAAQIIPDQKAKLRITAGDAIYLDGIDYLLFPESDPLDLAPKSVLSGAVDEFKDIWNSLVLLFKSQAARIPVLHTPVSRADAEGQAHFVLPELGKQVSVQADAYLHLPPEWALLPKVAFFSLFFPFRYAAYLKIKNLNPEVATMHMAPAAAAAFKEKAKKLKEFGDTLPKDTLLYPLTFPYGLAKGLVTTTFKVGLFMGKTALKIPGKCWQLASSQPGTKEAVQILDFK